MTDPRQRLLAALTSIYLLLPASLFAYGWFKLPFAIITILLLLIFIALAVSDSVQAIQALRESRLNNLAAPGPSLKWILPALLFITIWLLLSGVGGFGFQNPDYAASNALLKDLIFQPWPLTSLMAGVSTKVVYYVGYYLPAAAIGKVWGWTAANLFIFIWTAGGTFLAFAWFWRLSRIDFKTGPTRLIWLALVFCLAGGLDYLAQSVLTRQIPNLTSHFETWAGYFQYSSNTTLMYWVPQHTLAAWLSVSLIVSSLYDPPDLRRLGMPLAASLIWSPFGMVGLAPYLLIVLVFYLAPHRRALLFNRPVIFAAAASMWVGGLHLLYLLANRYNFPKDWIWELTEDRLRLFNYLIAFWFVEFALLAALILLLPTLDLFPFHLDDRARPRALLEKWFRAAKQRYHLEPEQFLFWLVSLAVLTVLPLFKVGFLNDLVMRGSIPSLFIYWMVTAKVVTEANLQEPAWALRVRSFFLYLLIVVIVILGFLPSLSEISRSIRFYHAGPPALTEVLSTANANPSLIVEQRAGNQDSVFYRYIGK